jgi:hypothetical protein
MIPADEPGPLRRGDRREWICVIAALSVYLVYQIHATAFHGYMGQDWNTHKLWIARAARDPWNYFNNYTWEQTNPPLYHLIAGAVKRIIGLKYYLPAIALMNVAYGFAGVCFAYGVVRRLIASGWLRIAAIVFVLFLPFAMIHAQVVASDALATPLFWLLLWLIVSFRPNSSTRQFAVRIVLLSFLLSAAIFVKFTFESVVIAAAVWTMSLWWTGQLTRSRLATMLVIVCAVPSLVGYREMVRYNSQAHAHTFVRPSMAALTQSEMNPRSLLSLRPADVDVLSAPQYDQRNVDGTYNVVTSNKHSYAAILHLAMFTDILNIYQFDPYDYYFGQRTVRNEERMRAAVRTAVVASALTVIAVCVLLMKSSVSVLIRRNPADFTIWTVLLFCGAWFANIVGVLPFVSQSYGAGYWLPRLTAPALIGFFVLAFVAADKSRRISKPWRIMILLAVLVQSTLHASFLWPTRSPGPLIEPHANVAAAGGDVVVRVLSWQNGPSTDAGGACWIDRTMGIVVNRPEGRPVEEWTLTFTATPGPARQNPHRVIRVSSRDLAPTLVQFDARKHVALKVPLAAGRNDIVIEVVEPAAEIEPPDDPLIRVVQLSNIALHDPEWISDERPDDFAFDSVSADYYNNDGALDTALASTGFRMLGVNGSVTLRTVAQAQPGVRTITVEASSTWWRDDEPANFTVTVRRPSGAVLNAKSFQVGQKRQSVSVPVRLDIRDSLLVNVRFENDRYEPGKGDRNLLIHAVRIE